MDVDFPEALQIEVTNKCNFNCRMCIRRVWNAKPSDLNLDLYKKIAESSFPLLERLILYGLGEPFIHPGFLEMLRIARRYLSKKSEIIINTNGSLLAPHIAEKVLKIGIDSLSFSIDTMDAAKLGRIRDGSKPSVIMKNFHHVAEMKRNAERELRLGVEAVIMKDNFKDLPNLVENLAQKELDYILVSHVVPYTEEIFRNSIYITLSKPSFEIIKPSLKYGWNLIRDAAQALFGRMYGIDIGLKAAEIVKGFWEEAGENGYWINLPLLFDSKDKIDMIDQVEEAINRSRKIAREYQVDLKIPSLYPDAKKRRCPYIDKNTMVVRSNGIAVPCLEFAYSHPMYVNTHLKKIHAVSFGDLEKETVRDIWNKETYIKFREIRRNLAENIPWCGDCPYSTLGCFYTKTNDLDCYANEPGCSECIYSVNLAQCNI